MHTKTDTLRLLEQLAPNAWPAHTNEKLGDWTLRYTFGYTKRANSVRAVGSLPLDPNWLQKVENFYESKNASSCFHISQLSPAQLDETLALKGYQKIDECFTMMAACEDVLQNVKLDIQYDADYLSEATSAWVHEFLTLEDFSKDRFDAYTHIFSSINAPKTFLRLSGTNETIGLGSVVVEQGYGCISNVVVHAKHRRKGIAKELVSALVQCAQRQEADYVYLQVVKGNQPAVDLYEKLGFKAVSSHHYRILKK
ncbi:GNAT family N-acetyltransferase [Priestia sp. GS2]|uniref:GNAT family N-acetyltransferase n=1 Tax=Priestia sp. GS2 TaxID=3117403 RepID=UPI002ED8A013